MAGTTTILVLDDESNLRGLFCYLLQSYGYRTLEAASAEEALRRFHENDCAIDLLLADVRLPQSSGIQVALTLRADRPDLRVILASGSPEVTWNARDCALLQRLGPASVSILHKPFAPQVLVSAIRDLIGAID